MLFPGKHGFYFKTADFMSGLKLTNTWSLPKVQIATRAGKCSFCKWETVILSTLSWIRFDSWVSYEVVSVIDPH